MPDPVVMLTAMGVDVLGSSHCAVDLRSAVRGGFEVSG